MRLSTAIISKCSRNISHKHIPAKKKKKNTFLPRFCSGFCSYIWEVFLRWPFLFALFLWLLMPLAYRGLSFRVSLVPGYLETSHCCSDLDAMILTWHSNLYIPPIPERAQWVSELTKGFSSRKSQWGEKILPVVSLKLVGSTAFFGCSGGKFPHHH